MSVNLVAVHAHARAPMAGNAMAPCASAAELASVCMFQLNNITKILKFRKMEPQEGGPSPPKKQKVLGKEEALKLRKECIA